MMREVHQPRALPWAVFLRTFGALVGPKDLKSKAQGKALG